MMYGTLVKSAPDAMNATRRVPASISVPSVGQPLAGNEADGGEYASVSTPAVWNAEANCDTARLSELTMSKETTVRQQAPVSLRSVMLD